MSPFLCRECASDDLTMGGACEGKVRFVCLSCGHVWDGTLKHPAIR